MTAVAHSLQLRTLRARPTIATRGCCDLKIEDEHGSRWWLCHNAASDHRITVEKYDPTTATYITTDVFVDEENQ